MDIFNRTILNILSNFISHEFVVSVDMVHKSIRALIQEENVAFQNYPTDSSNNDLKYLLKYLQASLNASIEVPNEKYYHNTTYKLINNKYPENTTYNTTYKLINTQKKSKLYWSLLEILLNNKKIPIILPLFYQNRFITDFREKVQLFNIFFSKQCSFFPNSSSFPTDVNYITDKRLSTVTFSAKDTGKIIQ